MRDNDNAGEELWSVTGRRCVDPQELAQAVARVAVDELDARGKDLLRASRRALSGHSTQQTGFPTLSSRLRSTIKKTTIEQYLREMGLQISVMSRIVIGGSSALILQGLLNRNTEAIDLVDEVPEVLRNLHDWRSSAKQRYGLYLAHFQSHYLPRGWEKRLHSVGGFGRLEIFLVDPIDIFVGKLFSRRTKDLDDLRELSGQLERSRIDTRLVNAVGLLADAQARSQAEYNYYIVYGEEPDL